MENEEVKITKKEKRVAIITLLVFILIVASITSLYYMEKMNNENHIADNNIKINAFKNDKKFVCKPLFGGNYLVSEDQHWSIHNEYFKKDALLVPIYSCKADIK